MFWLLCSLALIAVLAACGKSGESPRVHQAANGDLQEETASLHDLPAFLDERPNKVKLAYEAAAALQDTLQWIPCYCGCGESAGHRNNLHCFIHEVRKDGTVVWDDHGTRCDVCLSIALQSAQLKSQGKSNAEIRQFIDATYKTGYSNPTDTPVPVS
ncbi:hypothetical protein E5161_13755 [Cohnella pontilimi]|uniref:Lipoprotein n=1 Tax=Cohnella pontilimi TaxID=2564100 RepID=A0A4U0FA51_9BACL|nr:hypothetical protein E5161_13755 [Cohnella pontilimi]